MRLIDCREMRMVEFIGEDIPPYAILSHTWGKEEVGFKDFGTGEAWQQAGWHKIQQTCKTALAEGIAYAWVDTCCIDKSSSAELTEAINSMFQWYAPSRVCYAFLEDCAEELNKEQLASCRWMSRGWTLQELIAPRSVIFFDREWARIPVSLLDLPDGPMEDILQSFPICAKMSWAAGRKTTRVEDAAYCLMGLFDVNMPLLYGEGRKAFARLQEEIMRRSEDMTIFALGAATSEYGAEAGGILGLLAKSPDAFANSSFTRINASSQEFSLTNRGIHISAKDVRADGKRDGFILCLSDGPLYSSRGKELLGVAIQAIGGGLFVRSRPEVLLTDYTKRNRLMMSPTVDLYLVTDVNFAISSKFNRVKFCAIRLPQLEEVNLYCTRVFPQLQFQHDSNLFIT